MSRQSKLKIRKREKFEVTNMPLKFYKKKPSQLNYWNNNLFIFKYFNRFGETVLDVIERTSKIDMYQNKTDKYSALTPDIRIHYHTVYK